MLDVPRGPAACMPSRRSRRSSGGSRRLCPASFPASALHPEPQRTGQGRARPHGRHRARARSPRAHWRPVRSDHPRRARRRRLRPLVRAGSGRPEARRTATEATLRRPGRDRPLHAHDQARRRRPARPRRDRQGLRGRPDREALSQLGPCLVNAGGDVAVRGRRWPIGVETANGFVTLELVSGALATSGRDRRRWRRNGEEQHHLIDPATGRPSNSDLVRVTVVGSSAAEAEVLAKSLFLAGEEQAIVRSRARSEWPPSSSPATGGP